MRLAASIWSAPGNYRPCQLNSPNGLDPQTWQEMKSMIQNLAEHGALLIMASHHPEDLLPCITHSGMIENGQFTKFKQRKCKK